MLGKKKKKKRPVLFLTKETGSYLWLPSSETGINKVCVGGWGVMETGR